MSDYNQFCLSQAVSGSDRKVYIARSGTMTGFVKGLTKLRTNRIVLWMQCKIPFHCVSKLNFVCMAFLLTIPSFVRGRCRKPKSFLLNTSIQYLLYFASCVLEMHCSHHHQYSHPRRLSAATDWNKPRRRVLHIAVDDLCLLGVTPPLSRHRLAGLLPEAQQLS